MLARSAAMLRHLESSEGQLFIEWLTETRLREYTKLMHSKDMVEMHRAQGAVGIIDLIKSLSDDLRQYERDVVSGKVKPLKEG
jgi:hypothetical protein